MRKSKLWLTLALLLSGLALADASDSKTFTITVSAVESVSIDTGQAPLTVDYNNSGGICSTADRFCAWYPSIIYSTNYTTNRKLVAKATVSDPGMSVVLVKQTGTQYENPFVPNWGGGNSPGQWAFQGNSLTLSATDQDIVVGIQNGTNYVAAPALRVVFSSDPPAGTHTATVTVTIMAQ